MKYKAEVEVVDWLTPGRPVTWHTAKWGAMPPNEIPATVYHIIFKSVLNADGLRTGPGIVWIKLENGEVTYFGYEEALGGKLTPREMTS